MENTNETMMLALAGMTVVLEYGLVLAAALTYGFERPVARWLAQKWGSRRDYAGSPDRQP